jgi:DNA/RNA-binding domain of Phe-tRNA-synthetase-like protein
VFAIAPEFKGAARLGIIEMRDVRVSDTPEELKSELNRLAAEAAQEYKDTALGNIPTVQKIRTIFHRSGLDPTRYRPSSESLLRRAVKGKGLYFINSVVDLINYFSLKSLCPMGLYDAEKLVPPIEWRIGKPGETYEGIGRNHIIWITFSPPALEIPLDEYATTMKRINGGTVSLATQFDV